MIDALPHSHTRLPPSLTHRVALDFDEMPMAASHLMRGGGGVRLEDGMVSGGGAGSVLNEDADLASASGSASAPGGPHGQRVHVPELMLEHPVDGTLGCRCAPVYLCARMCVFVVCVHKIGL